MASRTQNKIMQAAADVFLKRGYDDVTTDHIVGLAGVSNSSLFHHFKTKLGLAEALIMDIATRRHNRILSALEEPGATGPAGLEVALTAVLQWAEEAPDLGRLALILPSQPFSAGHATARRALREREIEALQIWAAPLMKSNAICRYPFPVLHALIFGPADQIVRRWLEDATCDRPTTLTASLAEAAWKVLAVRVDARDPPKAVAGRRPQKSSETSENPQLALGLFGSTPHAPVQADDSHGVAADIPKDGG
jgi:AcrR family transcriptional regulator